MEVIDATWPETCLSDDPDRPKLHAPFRWHDWLVYTTGRIAAALPVTDPDVQHDPSMDAPALQGLDTDLPEPRTAALDALREWAGPWREGCTDCTPEQREAGPCAVCDGEGWVFCECDCGHEHDAECRECDGPASGCQTCDQTGEVGDWNIRHGFVDGVGVNRRLLARLLHGAPGETVVLSRQRNPASPVILVGEGWRGLLMPMRVYDQNAAEFEGAPDVLDLVGAKP